MAFAGMGGGGGDDEELAPVSEINVTPLVDVMLVLLIVFMVAAPMMMTGVPVNLPRTAAPRAAPPVPPVILTVTRDGRTFIKQDEVPEAELSARIRDAQGGNEEVPVYVRGDRAAPYGEVLRIMGRVAAGGIPRVSLIAEADTGAVTRAR